MQEIIRGVSVEERAHTGTFRLQIWIPDDHQAFFAVGDIKEAVDQRNWLLFIFGKLHAERINAERRGRRHCDGVFRWHKEFLAQGRNGRAGDALGKTFVVNVGDVKNAEAAFALCDIGVFSARLNIENGARMFVGGGEFAAVRDEFLVVAGIGDALQVAAVDGVGLIMFSDGHGFQPVVSGRHIDVAAHEIHEVGALEQELGQPGVVVVGGGNVAIAALLGFLCANRVRNEGAEGLAGKSRRGDGLLLVVQPFTVRILRTDQHGAGRARRRDAVAGDRAVHAEHVDVVAKNLKIVAGVIARGEAFVVQHVALGVAGHLQMAAKAGGSPGSVAGIAGHGTVGVGEHAFVVRENGEDFAGLAQQFRAIRLGAEMHIARGDGVARLHDFPFLILIAHGALHERVRTPFEAAQSPRRAQCFQVTSACGRSGAGGNEAGVRANGAMTIDTIDFDRGARLAINLSVAVIVLTEVAINALHSLLEVNVGEMNGFAETLGIIEADLPAFFVQPIAFAIVRVNAPVNPAVAVEIGELRGLKLFIKFRAASLFEKFFVAPQAASGGSFGIFPRRLVALFIRGIFLLRRIHLLAVNFVVPPRDAEIGGEHVRAGMHVADHALARRNRAREDVLNGMAGLQFVDGRIGSGAGAGVAEGRISGGMRGIAVIRVNHVTRRTSAGAIIAGMIVGTRQRHHGIDEARFLQAEKNRIGAKLGAEAAVA